MQDNQITTKQQSDNNSEVTRMMASIWEEHHNPDKIINEKHKKNRESFGKEYI